MKNFKKLNVAVAISLALVMSGCSDDDDSNNAAPPTEPVPPTEPLTAFEQAATDLDYAEYEITKLCTKPSETTQVSCKLNSVGQPIVTYTPETRIFDNGGGYDYIEEKLIRPISVINLDSGLVTLTDYSTVTAGQISEITSTEESVHYQLPKVQSSLDNDIYSFINESDFSQQVEITTAESDPLKITKVFNQLTVSLKPGTISYNDMLHYTVQELRTTWYFQQINFGEVNLYSSYESADLNRAETSNIRMVVLKRWEVEDLPSEPVPPIDPVSEFKKGALDLGYSDYEITQFCLKPAATTEVSCTLNDNLDPIVTYTPRAEYVDNGSHDYTESKPVVPITVLNLNSGEIFLVDYSIVTTGSTWKITSTEKSVHYESPKIYGGSSDINSIIEDEHFSHQIDIRTSESNPSEIEEVFNKVTVVLKPGAISRDNMLLYTDTHFQADWYFEQINFESSNDSSGTELYFNREFITLGTHEVASIQTVVLNRW